MLISLLSPLISALSNDALLVCDLGGAVIEASAVAEQRLTARPGLPFRDMLSSLSRAKGARFWKALCGLPIGAVSEPWELYFQCPGTLAMPSSARGGRIDEGHLLVAAAAETPQITRLYQEVLAINGELTTLVRRLTREQAALNEQLELLLASSRVGRSGGPKSAA